MKVTTLPLPTPWTADTAVLHLYRVWSNRGRVQLHQITFSNPNMVNALLSLWERDHLQERGTQHSEIASGMLAGIGSWSWQLLQEPDGTGTIVIEHVEDR